VKVNKTNDESKPTTGRGKPCKDRPWLWIEKKIMRTIRDVFDATNDVSSALALCLAMTEIASDEQSDTFTKPIAEIAKRAGLKYRTTISMLSRFEELRFIRIERNTVPGTKLQAPSTYTLCNHCIPLCNGRIQRSLPRGMKNNEKSENNNNEKPARARETSAATPATEKSSILNLEEAEKLAADVEEYEKAHLADAEDEAENWKPSAIPESPLERARRMSIERADREATEAGYT
jgi:hypothetical protein